MHRLPPDRRDARVVDPDKVCDATAVLADEERLRRSASVLDALGDVHRLSILMAVYHAGELCVSDIAFAVGMSDSAVSHALRLLKRTRWSAPTARAGSCATGSPAS
ncbi:hypothetical protein BJF78_32335 [Pseudonocardia sp. CNS-139]|nr:hypothetical protein BJF78_32335 [Pseudonocardia sp. CNS-139]